MAFSHPSLVSPNLVCSECGHKLADHSDSGCMFTPPYESPCACKVTAKELYSDMRCLEFRAYMYDGKVCISMGSGGYFAMDSKRKLEYLRDFIIAITNIA